MELKAAIFDIGATLVTGPPVAPNKVIANLIGNVSPQDVSSLIMTTELYSAEDVCCKLSERFGKLSDSAVAGICELWKSQSNACVEIENATNAVVRIKNKGLKIALLSDIWNPYFLSVEKAIPDIISIADVISLSFRNGTKKPDKRIFQKVLDDLSVKPHEAVMIGDTYTHDIEPAIELGLKTVWVLARPDREIGSIISILNGEKPSPTITIDNIKELDL